MSGPPDRDGSGMVRDGAGPRGGGRHSMVKRWPLLLCALLVVAANGCSKPQDTAPEQRIFGTPPTINSVSMTSQHETAHCDITQVVLGKLCAGGVLINEIAFSPSSTIEVDVGYHQLFFNVGVTDPESTSTATDILLVTVSSQTPPDKGPIEENSLVLLDDGSETTFPYNQTGGDPEACSIDRPNNGCACFAAEYTLTSNDPTKADDTFTRGFGFVGPGPSVPPGLGEFLVNNCLARDKHQAPASSDKVLDHTIGFRVEAVD